MTDLYKEIDEKIEIQKVDCTKESLNLTCEEGRTLIFVIKLFNYLNTVNIELLGRLPKFYNINKCILGKLKDDKQIIKDNKLYIINLVLIISLFESGFTKLSTKNIQNSIFREIITTNEYRDIKVNFFVNILKYIKILHKKLYIYLTSHNNITEIELKLICINGKKKDNILKPYKCETNIWQISKKKNKKLLNFKNFLENAHKINSLWIDIMANTIFDNTHSIYKKDCGLNKE